MNRRTPGSSRVNGLKAPDAQVSKMPPKRPRAISGSLCEVRATNLGCFSRDRLTQTSRRKRQLTTDGTAASIRLFVIQDPMTHRLMLLGNRAVASAF